jgi:MoaA/NifB/PqqE/SkfB family radical SAM enzyme
VKFIPAGICQLWRRFEEAAFRRDLGKFIRISAVARCQSERQCGCCEFRNACMGCRARAFAATGISMKNPFVSINQAVETQS